MLSDHFTYRGQGVMNKTETDMHIGVFLGYFLLVFWFLPVLFEVLNKENLVCCGLL